MITSRGLGIALRENEAVLVCLRRTWNRVSPEIRAAHPLEPSLPPARRFMAIEEFIERFRNEHDLEGADVHVGFPDTLVMLREITLPLAVKENLAGTLSYEMEKYVPLPVDRIHFTHQILAEDRSSGVLRVLLAVVRREDLDPYLDFCRRMTGGVSGLESLASARSHAAALAPGGGKLREVVGRWLASGGDAGTEIDAAIKAGEARMGMAGGEDRDAVGLALKGLVPVPVDLNLLPRRWRRRPGRAGAYLMVGLAATALVAALALTGGYVFRHRMEARNLDTEIERLMVEARAAEKLRQRLDDTRTRLEGLVRLRRETVPAVDVLRELSRLVPETAWVQEFSLAGGKGQIGGFADNASELVPLLEASPLFSEVAFLAAITRDPAGKERFSVGFSLEPLVKPTETGTEGSRG